MPTSPFQIPMRGAVVLVTLLGTVPAAAEVTPLGSRVVLDWGGFPSLAVDPTGRFAVLWDKDNQYTSLDVAFLQTFDTEGEPMGSKKLLTKADPEREIFTSALAVDGTGSYLVTWVDRRLFENGAALYARFFDALGKPQGGAIRLVDEQPDIQNHIADAVRNRQGDALVVWRTWDFRSEPWKEFLHVRRFDSRNRPLGRVFTVRSAARPAELGDSQAALDGRGRFVVTWTEKAPAASQSRYVFQRYGRDGEKRGKRRLLTRDPASFFSSAVIAAEPSGEFVAVWMVREGEHTERRIKARWFDAFGRPLTGEVAVTGVGEFGSPAVGRDRFGNTAIL